MQGPQYIAMSFCLLDIVKTWWKYRISSFWIGCWIRWVRLDIEHCGLQVHRPFFSHLLDAGSYQGLTGDDTLLLPMDLTKFDTHQNCVNKVLEHFGKVSKTNAFFTKWDLKDDRVKYLQEGIFFPHPFIC